MVGLSGAEKLEPGSPGAGRLFSGSEPDVKCLCFLKLWEFFANLMVCRNLGTARRFSLLAQLYCHPQRQPEKRHTGNALVGLGRHLVAL